MSRENVEVVRGSFDFWNRNDPEGLLPFLAPQMEWVPPDAWPEDSVHRGEAGTRAFFRTWREFWDEFHVEPLRLVDVGSTVFCHGLIRGRGKQSGLAIEMEYGQVTTFRYDGKVIRNELFLTPGEAREAVGLREYLTKRAVLGCPLPPGYTRLGGQAPVALAFNLGAGGTFVFFPIGMGYSSAPASRALVIPRRDQAAALSVTEEGGCTGPVRSTWPQWPAQPQEASPAVVSLFRRGYESEARSTSRDTDVP